MYSTRYSSQILKKIIFSKNVQISGFTKIRPVGTELFHADRWTNVKLTDVFRNFANTSRDCTQYSPCVYMFYMDLRTNSDF